MTSDRMQDVFPIEFEFVKGEQPTAEKLTGFVKQTNFALSQMTGTVGDPLDYQSHGYDLSPENLAQVNLARVVGPSDYLSPRGGCFNERSSSALTVYLASKRNSWNLGFPLVKVSDHIDPEESSIGVVPLEWGTDITVSSSYLVTRVASPDLVDSDGKFYVDFYAGTIISYDKPGSQITLTIAADSFNMLGPGAPWTTHNVIPAWDDTEFLSITSIPDPPEGTEVWRLGLPTVYCSSRNLGSNRLIGRVERVTGTLSSVTYSTYTPGQGSKYRMPNQLVDNLSEGDEIPEGFIYLWDESSSRVLPLIVFKYYDENSVTVEAPEGFLTASGVYRLILVGSSAAENISFLNTVARDNTHIGLSRGQGQDTLFYTPPLSHDNLTELYNGEISSYFASADYRFRKSSYPTNPHPQYLHRNGWMVGDKTVNLGNSMKGNLVFAGTSGSTPTDTGYNYSSYGIYFGSNPDNTGTASKIKISFEGGENILTWASGPAVRYGFDHVLSNYSGATKYKGALVIDSEHGQPLYLETSCKEHAATGVGGAALGFDYANYHEMNYVKLCRSELKSSYEKTIQPANYDGSNTALFITPNLNSASVHQRISMHQTREYRFGAASYNANATNTDNSIGAAGFSTTNTGPLGTQYDVEKTTDSPRKIFLDSTYGDCSEEFIMGRKVKFTPSTGWSLLGYTISSVDFDGTFTVLTVTEPITAVGSTTAKIQMHTTEFDKYYMSPAVVGSDFFNVYLNAIFFSDTGDGQDTSFNDHGTNWLDNGFNTSIPSGIYFSPAKTLLGPYFSFYGYDSNYPGGAKSTAAFSVGDRQGFWYTGDGAFVSISGDYTSALITAGVYLLAGYRSLIMTKSTDIWTSAAIGIFADGGDIYLEAKTEADPDRARHMLLTTAKTNATDSAGNIYLQTGKRPSSETRASVGIAGGEIRIGGSFGLDWGELTAASEQIILFADTVDVQGGLIENTVGNLVFSTSLAGSDITLSSARHLYLTASTTGYVAISGQNITLRNGMNPSDDVSIESTLLDITATSIQIHDLTSGSAPTHYLCLNASGELCTVSIP